MKLLIADDQRSVHLFLDKMISWETLGITSVLHARDGEEALALIKEEQPQLLMLDIRMPVMDGLTLLEKLSGIGWEHRVMILSAYSEFEYARKCMVYGVKDYLLKPIDTKEVVASLQKNIHELSALWQQQFEQAVTEFISAGGLPVQDRFRHEAARMLPGKGGYGIVCCRKEDVPEGVTQQQDGGSKPDEAGGTGGAVRLLFSCPAAELVIRVFGVDAQEGWLRFYETLSQNNQETTVGFSVYHDRREEFWTALGESVEALQQGFYQAGAHLYREESRKLCRPQETGQLSEELRRGYSNGDVQGMKRAVDRLFFIFERVNAHPRYVQEFCYGFLMQLNSDFVKTLETLEGHSFTAQSVCSDAAGLKNTFLRLMLSMRSGIEPETVQTDEEVVRRIHRYIDTNFEKDLSLTTLGKHFFISKYQISRLFKKEYGVNCSDYILQVRMEAAAMMLQSSREKVDEIARRSGFEETSYFSRVFSKYYGMSPGEFRKRTPGKEEI